MYNRRKMLQENLLPLLVRYSSCALNIVEVSAIIGSDTLVLAAQCSIYFLKVERNHLLITKLEENTGGKNVFIP